MKRIVLITLCMLCAQVCWGQAWLGVIDPARAIDWSAAGVVGGIPDGSWNQCGTTIAPYGTQGTPGSPAFINSAIASCSANQYVLLGTGTFYLNGKIDFASKSNVVLRGMGADQTIVRFTAGPGTGCMGLGGGVCIISQDNFDIRDSVQNSANWTAGYAKGATSITLSNTTNMQVGTLLVVWQADQGSDPGTIWNCQNFGVLGDCSVQGGQNGPSGNSQTQTVTVTSVPGGGAGGAVGITPGLYSPIWGAAFTPQAGWNTHLPVHNDGVENLTLDGTLTADSGTSNGTFIFFGWAQNCWVTGVRTINNGAPPYRNNIWSYLSSHLTIQSNYIYGSNGSDLSYGIEVSFMSNDVLVANNILQHTSSAEMVNGGTGNVFAYNFVTDNYYTASQSAPQFQQSDSYPSHQDGSYLNLFEGNVGAKVAADDIHGTSWMNTEFRNYWTGRDGPFKFQSTMVGDIETYARYFNLVGNVLGEAGYHTTYKDIPASNVDNTGCGTTGNVSIFALGWAGGQACNYATVYNDTFVAPSAYFWGNFDVVTSAVRWCGNSGNTGWVAVCGSVSEVPTALGVYAQPVPANQKLPTSFYYASKPSWYTDGIGLTAIPYPAIGPDVTGVGPGGLTNIIPAQACFNNTSYDTNYAISDSINMITESGATATAQLFTTAPPGTLAFFQYNSFWIKGSPVVGYNRLWQLATVSGPIITFTATPGLGSAGNGVGSGILATTNAIHSFNANTCYTGGVAPPPPSGMNARQPRL
jgi:hypothetical protein